MIINIDTFTGVLAGAMPSEGFTGHTQPAVWTPTAGLLGTLTWGPSAGVERGDDGVITGYPDVSGIPDNAVIDDVECIIEGGGSSTFPVEARVVTIGAGADGTVTITQTAGLFGGDGTKQIIVVLAGTSDAPLSVTNFTSGGLMTVTLGTDGGGAADPAKNTATLVAAAINAAVSTVLAVASGNGATAVGTKALTNFAFGFGFAQSTGNWATPGTLIRVPLLSGGWGSVTPATTPWSQWLTWTGERVWDARQWNTGLTFPYLTALPLAITSKEALAACQVGYGYLILGHADDELKAGSGSVTVTRFTLRVTYHISSVTLGVEAGSPQIARGPTPSTVRAAAELKGADLSGTLSYLWTLEDGPDVATIVTPTQLITDLVFDFPTSGDYVFRITVTVLRDNEITFVVHDDLIVTIKTSSPPIVSSGSVRLGIY